MLAVHTCTYLELLFHTEEHDTEVCPKCAGQFEEGEERNVNGWDMTYAGDGGTCAVLDSDACQVHQYCGHAQFTSSLGTENCSLVSAT